jgi:hypothetical protein
MWESAYPELVFRSPSCSKGEDEGEYPASVNDTHLTVIHQIPRILPSQMNRFHLYTKYVKRLHIFGYWRDELENPTFLLNIFALQGGQPLFPALSTVIAQGYWLRENYAAPVLGALLSSGTIRQLELHTPIMLPADHEQVTVIMDAIQRLSPDLVTLSLHFVPKNRHDSIDSTLRQFLPGFNSLQVLVLDPVYATADLMLCLGKSLPQLRALGFTAGGTHHEREEIHPSDSLSPVRATSHLKKPSAQAHFPELTHLLLQVTYCCGFEEMMTRAFRDYDHSLQDLTIEVSGAHYSASGVYEDHRECAEASYTTIAQRFPILHSLHINAHQTDFHSLDRRRIEPLFACEHLTNLELRNISLTTSQLVNLLAAWPNLETLRLVGHCLMNLWVPYREYYMVPADLTEEDESYLQSLARDEDPNGGFQLTCLGMIRNAAPRIKRLGLTFIASSTAHLIHKCDSESIPFKNLEVLELHGSFFNFRHPEFVELRAALYISSFLPSATRLSYRGDDSLVRYRNISYIIEDETPGQAWLDYAREYGEFCQRFSGNVELARTGVLKLKLD